MARTRAAFKLALRYCRDHEDRLRAGAVAKNLGDKDFKSFWRNISKYNNDKSTKYANTVGDCSGDDNITEMWRKHFEHLYNSVDDDVFKQLFYHRLENLSPCTAVFNVHRVLACLLKQKNWQGSSSMVQKESKMRTELKRWTITESR